jgi:4-amino-4-deoxy-L-arabinose transferase-like glycosyltransferase
VKTSTKILILFLFLLWVLPGTVGRDPWKADEPYSLGMVNHIVRTGDWVVPAVAGVPFLEKPPLYYLSASAFVAVLSPPLAPHDAARLVNVFWLLAVLVALGLAAREVAGERAAWTAPVLLLGCVILVVPAHKLLTDIGLLAGFTTGLYGLSISRRSPGWGGFWIGTGMGIGFLSKGLLAPGALAILAAALPVLFRTWRTRNYATSLAISLPAILPWVVIWPLALFLRSPESLIEWFWVQNLSRYFGYAYIGERHSPASFVLNLSWIAWPVLPFAAWSVWRTRAEWRSHAVWQLPLAASVLLIAVLAFSAAKRPLYTLPLLPPLCLMAATASDAVPQRIRSAMHGAGVALFGLLGIVLWTGWLLHVNGSSLFARFLPALTVHYPPVDGRLLAGALACTFGWVLLVVLARIEEAPLLFTWTAGIALVWGLAMTLWLPWLEAQGSFRDVFTPVRERLPAGHGCVASYGLGESERAMLEYFAGVRPKPLESAPTAPCDLLLIGSGDGNNVPSSDADWKLLWKGTRPREEAKERYALYLHVGNPAGAAPLISREMVRRN